MRLSYTKDEIIKKLFPTNCVIYGRSSKGSRLIQDLFNPRYYYKTSSGSSPDEFQGWVHMKDIKGCKGFILKLIHHDIIYITSLLNGLYTIYIIRKLKDPYIKCEREYYYNIEKSDVLKKIGIDCNSYIYYNNEFDKDHSVLNTFRLAFDPKFDLNIAEKVNGNITEYLNSR